MRRCCQATLYRQAADAYWSHSAQVTHTHTHTRTHSYIAVRVQFKYT